MVPLQQNIDLFVRNITNGGLYVNYLEIPKIKKISIKNIVYENCIIKNKIIIQI